MKKIKTLCIILLILFQYGATAQSYFSSKQEVINYFEGNWTLDAVAWMGIIDTLPSEIFLDSSTHTYEFILTNMDSLPLLCKSYVNGVFHEESLVDIEFIDNDGFPGPWRLINLPDHLSNYVAILEDASYFYELSEDSLTLFQVVFDGLEYGLSRNLPSNITEKEKVDNIKIYPNPVINNEICYKANNGVNIIEVRIFDYAGKEYDSESQNYREGCFELKNGNTGIFIIELLDDKGKIYREKIVKIR